MTAVQVAMWVYLLKCDPHLAFNIQINGVYVFKRLYESQWLICEEKKQLHQVYYFLSLCLFFAENNP